MVNFLCIFAHNCFNRIYIFLCDCRLVLYTKTGSPVYRMYISPEYFTYSTAANHMVRGIHYHPQVAEKPSCVCGRRTHSDRTEGLLGHCVYIFIHKISSLRVAELLSMQVILEYTLLLEHNTSMFSILLRVIQIRSPCRRTKRVCYTF